MARNEWIMKLREQIAEIDMAIMTAATSELAMLEWLREDLVKQLNAEPYPRMKLAA